jgi:nicotinamide mononucleotide transporter
MLTGLWCVILVAKGRIFNYYLGLANVIGYAYIAYGYQLWGEVMLNALYFLPMQFVGLWIWTRNKDAAVKDKVEVKFLTTDSRVIWFLMSIVATVMYGLWLQHLEDPVPFLDSASTVLSIIAMILMAWRYMEQWVLWIVVDIVSIVIWYLVVLDKGTNDIAMLVMWSAYLINAVYGFLMWIKMYKAQEKLI